MFEIIFILLVKKGPPKADRKVVIINKGAYTANMRLTYNQPVGDYNVELIAQHGSIVAGQSYIFCRIVLVILEKIFEIYDINLFLLFKF